jgi:hypothetical protein
MKMSTLIYSIIFICVLAISIMAIYLSWLNWSEKVQGPVLSILLVGAGTIIAAIFSILKETTITDLYPSTVIVDFHYKPGAILNKNSKAYERSSAIARYTQNIVYSDTKPYVAFTLPSSKEAWLRFNNEAIAYDIYNTIKIYSRGGALIDMNDGTEAINIKSISIPEDFTPVIPNKNNFHFKEFHAFNTDDLAKLPCNLPSGTIISFQSIDNPKNNVENVVVLTLTKPKYFDIEIIVSVLGLPNGMAKLSPVLKPTETEANNFLNYSVSIQYLAHFEKFTSGNSKTSGYIDWCNSIFKIIKDRFNDNAVNS